MRVLVVSHNVFDHANNMGKTLLAFFRAFSKDELAQFYVHGDRPATAAACGNYYRFTDKDALKSMLFPKKHFGCAIVPQEGLDLPSAGVTPPKTGKGGLLEPLRYILRNYVWKFAKWDTPLFDEWLRQFNPDLIFYAAGDYQFSYSIAEKIQKKAGKPLVVCTTDDYFLNNIHKGRLFGKKVHEGVKEAMYSLMENASAVVTLSDLMSRTYQEIFRKPAYTFYNSVRKENTRFHENADRISYIGNLGFGRDRGLLEIGRALKRMDSGNAPACVDVYTTETKKSILGRLKEKNGLLYQGPIPSSRIQEIMDNSMAVIHTESFDEKNKNSVRYSLSTKIAESLLNGPVLIAYGPGDVASMEYLAANEAGLVITDKSELEEKLREMIEHPEMRKQMMDKQRKLGRKNHDAEKEPLVIRETLEKIAKAGTEE